MASTVRTYHLLCVCVEVEGARRGSAAVAVAVPSLWPNVADVYDDTDDLVPIGVSDAVARGLNAEPDAPRRCSCSSTSPSWQVKVKKVK